MRFEGTNVLLAQYNYRISIGSTETNEEDVDLTIPALIDEYIVGIFFAKGGEQEMWEAALMGLD